MEQGFTVAGDMRRSIDRRPQVLQAGLIVGSLLAIAAVGYLYPLRSQRLGVLAAAGVIAAGLAWVLLKQPALGPIVLIVAALAVPFGIGTGTQSSINAALLACMALSGLWVVDVLVRTERRGWARSRTVPPLIGLAIITLIAFGVGQLGWFYRAGAPLRSQAGGVALFLLSIAAFLIVANRVPNERWLARLTWVFLGLGAALLAIRLSPFAGMLPDSLMAAQGSAFWTWLAVLPFGQAVYNMRLAARARVAMGLLTGGVILFGLGRNSGWTAGWLPPIIALFVTLWAGRPRWALAATLAGGVVVLMQWPQVYEILLGGGQYGNEWSAFTRWEAWRTALQLLPASPIIGFGPANYYFYTPMLRLIRWNIQFITHNQYLDLLLQTGVLGLGFFVWFAAEAGRLAWRLRQRVSTGFARGYVYASLGGLVGMLAAGMLVDWIIPFPYNIGLAGFRGSVLTWVFLGGLVVIEKRLKDEVAAELLHEGGRGGA